MPIYMDRHDLPEAVTAEAVAKVHQEDLKIQDQYGCRGLTYWFDEKRGTAFCLIEAPEEGAVKSMHNQAHGMIPNQIIEVDAHVVNAFLGRISDPAGKTGERNIINEPAFRTLMITNLPEAMIWEARVGREKSQRFIARHNEIIRQSIQQFGGREVKCQKGSFIVSFQSIIKGMQCAKDIQNQMQQPDFSEVDLNFKIGLSAGSPVNESPDLFGQTISLAQQLCNIATNGQIVISSEMKEELTTEMPAIFNDDTIRILNRGNEKFLNSLNTVMESMWNVTDFNIGDFARKLSLSKTQFYRKVTALSGFSPNDFIKEYRLKKAAEAISKQEGNISEIAYWSGFNSPSYFSKCFLERFGILPSSFAASIS